MYWSFRIDVLVWQQTFAKLLSCEHVNAAGVSVRGQELSRTIITSACVHVFIETSAIYSGCMYL